MSIIPLRSEPQRKDGLIAAANPAKNPKTNQVPVKNLILFHKLRHELTPSIEGHFTAAQLQQVSSRSNSNTLF